MPRRSAETANILNPIVETDGESCSMVTQFMAAFPAKALKNEVSNACFQTDEIVAALDFLFHGFEYPSASIHYRPCHIQDCSRLQNGSKTPNSRKPFPRYPSISCDAGTVMPPSADQPDADARSDLKPVIPEKNGPAIKRGRKAVP